MPSFHRPTGRLPTIGLLGDMSDRWEREGTPTAVSRSLTTRSRIRHSVVSRPPNEALVVGEKLREGGLKPLNWWSPRRKRASGEPAPAACGTSQRSQTVSRRRGVVEQWMPPPFLCIASYGIVVQVTPCRARASSVRL